MLSFHSAGPVLEHCNSLALDTGCSQWIVGFQWLFSFSSALFCFCSSSAFVSVRFLQTESSDKSGHSRDLTMVLQR